MIKKKFKPLSMQISKNVFVNVNNSVFPYAYFFVLKGISE